MNLETRRLVVDVDDWRAFMEDAAGRGDTPAEAFARLLAVTGVRPRALMTTACAHCGAGWPCPAHPNGPVVARVAA